MKTFRITFTSNPESGIYSANLVNAESAEQASAYFQTLGNYKVVGCTETQSEPKPGQPVHTVPEGWEAPEEEEEEPKRTTEEVTADIIEYFENNEDIFNDCMEELDSYNGYLGDDRYFSMDELDELYHGTEPSELLRLAFYGYDEQTYTTDRDGDKTYGAFNPNRDYFRYNGYGNLVSADYKDYTGLLDEYAIEAMDENRGYIDSIDNDEELTALFDELEAAAEEE